MKVAIITTQDLTRSYNWSLIINERLKHLVKFKDLEIYLVAPNNIPDELKKDLKHVRYTQYNKPILRFLSSFSAIPKLLREDYDLYHCTGEKEVSILLVARILKRNKSPILYEGFEVVGTIDTESKMLGKKLLKNRIIGRLKKFRKNLALKYSHAMVVQSEALKNYIVKHNIYKKDIFVIPIGPIGVNFELLGKKYKKDQTLANTLGLKNKKVIMYAGTITALQGVLDLVKAMEILNSKIEDVALVIVGDGTWAPMIKQYVEANKLRNVIFTGRVSHENIPIYHSIADVLVLPHVKRIGSDLQFPSKLLGYLASGRPIVSSNFKAIADVVGDNAILVEPGNPQAFAEGILTLLNNEELAKRIGVEGKKIVRNYTWEESAKKAYEAYKSLLYDYSIMTVEGRDEQKVEGKDERKE